MTKMQLCRFLLSGIISTALAMQAPFASKGEWIVELSPSWNVLGPFPIHAREQQFLSPSFPLNLSQPMDYSKSYPSSYADGGQVSWSTTTSDSDGKLAVSFPHIRWEDLRATEGWAALQHHALLHTTISVNPPSQGGSGIPHLLVHLVQGSYFTILPQGNTSTPIWYSGDIYDLERALPQVVPLPVPPSFSEPTTYDLFVSGDYEIRLFGDPHVRGKQVPIQNIAISVSIEDTSTPFTLEPSQDVVPNFVEGWSFGEALGVGIRSIDTTWTVTSVQSLSDALTLNLVRPTRIHASQTRIVPIRIVQSSAFTAEILSFDITLASDDGARTQTHSVILPIKQISAWTTNDYIYILGSYFYGKSMPTFFGAIPPKSASEKPPILFLHGAGVDIVDWVFSQEAFPRNNRSWFILASGRTSWGLDWHGPSAKDAWATVDALASILQRPDWQDWAYPTGSPVVLMGHSNGGQGAWWNAERFPDRVLAVVPAAGYLKSQAYVPWTMSRAAHYTDPALLAILDTSLTPDNNDLFLTNLAGTPVLAVHGGADENVPVWHSREAVSVLKTTYPDANVSYLEIPKEGHWFDSILNNNEVNGFVEAVLDAFPTPVAPWDAFTLTVGVPSESGTLHGWRINALAVPGRLGKLSIQRRGDDHVHVRTTNLLRLSVDTSVFPLSWLKIDDNTLYLDPSLGKGLVSFVAVNSKVWKVDEKPESIQPSGRIQTVLSSDGPLVLVVPNKERGQMSVGLRIAHDLLLFHRLDAEIISTAEALSGDANAFGLGNVVAIQGDQDAFGLDIAESGLKEKLAMMAPEEVLNGPGLGIMLLHAHPTNPAGNMVIMRATDDAGLEKVARLFPIRTGVAVPDWIIVGPLADTKGAGGVVSAGLWGDDWSWDARMSWTS
ncbi:hypothetical protein CYLTODRAFT_424805 [Cylindrobasidium torrendii FP15055 ss-10]|uniref:Peptidase S9 prolyl oligopeptidase catalytic domain-containing protein n=1 Tax=Cylindrobasidium torrendii FP15055 ss-10 TaxID=1314674 RepID=A0A0D7B5X0_9AGAR|nr:hypothetical protein CYLTODRAFT_424805 [Cylindrobasidium torrendii FP15055 ss-10]